MKKKLLSILLSGVIIITLLFPSFYVRAEGNDDAEVISESEETIDMDEEDTNSEDVQLNEGEAEQGEENENINIENNLNFSDYDSNLFKIVLYTLGKSSDESITKDDLETITKIDIDELKEEHRDLENAEIKKS